MKFQMGDVVEVNGKYKAVVIEADEHAGLVSSGNRCPTWHASNRLKLLARSRPVVRKTVEAWANVWAGGQTQLFASEHGAIRDARKCDEPIAIAVKLTGEYEVSE